MSITAIITVGISISTFLLGIIYNISEHKMTAIEFLKSEFSPFDDVKFVCIDWLGYKLNCHKFCVNGRV